MVADRILNWDEAIGVLVTILKGHQRGADDLDEPSPHFAAVMQRFLSGDPQYVAPFLNLWQNVEPRTPKVRWWYAVVWNEPEVGMMGFRCFAMNADEPNDLTFNDWIPLDAETWTRLGQLALAPMSPIVNLSSNAQPSSRMLHAWWYRETSIPA